MSARLRVAVAHGVCVGAGQCVLTAPELFGQDETGVVELLPGHSGGAEPELLRTAVNLCPSGALSVVHNPERSSR